MDIYYRKDNTTILVTHNATIVPSKDDLIYIGNVVYEIKIIVWCMNGSIPYIEVSLK